MLNKNRKWVKFIALIAVYTFVSAFLIPFEVKAQTQKAVKDNSTITAPSLVGYWQCVDTVDKIEDFVPGQKKWEGDLFLDEFSCFVNGRTTLKNWIWKDKLIIGKDILNGVKEVSASAEYYIKTINDSTYLFFPWLIPLMISSDNKYPYFVFKKISEEPREIQSKLKGSFQDISFADSIKKYDDVRWKDLTKLNLSEPKGLIRTLRFNERTVWPDSTKRPSADDPHKILKDGMNPGLGIHELHEKGITGKGVSVAIIDYPLYRDHPEFAGKINEYYDEGCQSESSMHGPAVLSLLVGTNCGTAPDAKVYFAATPDGSIDAAYHAKALDWIIKQNEKLPQSEKIRVVSVSAAPSGKGSPFKENNEMWDEACNRAEAKGIMVLDCTTHRGFIRTCYYDSADPENVAKCKQGFPGREFLTREGTILVPSSLRTTAEEYDEGECSYQFCGIGGLSWSIPYCSGVLALGWQLRPDLTSVQMKEILFQSAYINNDGNKIINPVEFIKMVKSYDTQTGLKDNKTGQFNLNVPYPNPFNPSTVISYQIPEETDINLTIFNTNGQKVNTLVDGIENSGSHSVVWNGTDSSGRQLASGIYLYRLKAGDFLKTEKMTFLR